MPMINIEYFLKEVTKIRNVSKGVDAAYVVRSRIGRLILTLAQIVAKEAHLSIPDRPGPIIVSDQAPQSVQELANVCNNLVEISRVLCQPSEPLDKRWKEGWTALLDQLDVLELVLRKMRSVTE